MPIITITNLKGGVWKTSLATNLSACFAHMGYRTALIDTDIQQQSSLKRSSLRPEELPPVTTLSLGEPESLRKNLPQIAQDYAVVIMDGMPAISPTVRTILQSSDLILSPVRASPADVWSVQKFAQYYFQEIRSLKEIQAYMVVNQHDTRKNRLSTEAVAALSGMGLPLLGTKLWYRVSYAEAMALGKGVYELENQKAKAEMAALMNEIMPLLKL